MKVNITINDRLLERANIYAKSNGLTRSGFFAMCISQYLNAVEQAPAMNKLLANMSLAFAKGNFTKEQLDELEAEFSQLKLQ